MAWSKAVEAIANSVSEIAKTVASYGPNDEGKAVKAAKKAGSKAKSLAAKSYPVCETEKEFKKKIVPLMDAGFLDDSVTNRQTYKYMRAQILEQTYKDAYNQVIDMYHQRMTMESGGVVPYTPQEQLDMDLASEDSQDFVKSTSAGCAGVALAIIIAFSGLISGLIYLV